MYGAGSSLLRHGFAVHMYTANKSMDNCAFCNADGDFLIVPQKGRLWITTECGKLLVSPGEAAVLPQGFRFSVDLPDGPSRGYVAEIFGTHFQLPDLGPIDAGGKLSNKLSHFEGMKIEGHDTQSGRAECRCLVHAVVALYENG
ncbi:homogentisate 1,2-dioxygenase-like [Syzygium oleosum]|uniref:homogentisate 1,2-dioxygenase-like n=1 Tax=Syzygium oleosum TaxID=219896 RepID=UPI0024B95921|nr:homogentisate 1,2-dioxygenase-like [Syzygium oleosum]